MKSLKIRPDKVNVQENNDPIFPKTVMMTNETLNHDFTKSVNTTLHKTAQKDIEITHHPVSSRKPRQLSGRHH